MKIIKMLLMIMCTYSLADTIGGGGSGGIGPRSNSFSIFNNILEFNQNDNRSFYFEYTIKGSELSSENSETSISDLVQAASGEIVLTPDTEGKFNVEVYDKASGYSSYNLESDDYLPVHEVTFDKELSKFIPVSVGKVYEELTKEEE